MYEYAAVVTNVRDGDTIQVEVDLGFDLIAKHTMRLYGIRAPKLEGVERELGIIARDRLRELILNKEVIIKAYREPKKYGTDYCADVYTKKDIGLYNVNDWMLSENLAVQTHC